MFALNPRLAAASHAKGQIDAGFTLRFKQRYVEPIVPLVSLSGDGSRFVEKTKALAASEIANAALVHIAVRAEDNLILSLGITVYERLRRQTARGRVVS